jgi:hypothetical protein
MRHKHILIDKIPIWSFLATSFWSSNLSDGAASALEPAIQLYRSITNSTKPLHHPKAECSHPD